MSPWNPDWDYEAYVQCTMYVPLQYASMIPDILEKMDIDMRNSVCGHANLSLVSGGYRDYVARPFYEEYTDEGTVTIDFEGYIFGSLDIDEYPIESTTAKDIGLDWDCYDVPIPGTDEVCMVEYYALDDTELWPL